MDSVSDTPSTGPMGGAAAAGQPVASRRLALIVAASVALLLALGWAADSLATLAPAVNPSSGVGQQAGLYRVALTLDPARPHAYVAQRYTLTVTDTSGHTVSDVRVQLTLTKTVQQMPAIHLTATPAGPGVYSADGALTWPGDWTMLVTLTPPSGAAVDTQFTITALS